MKVKRINPNEEKDSDWMGCYYCNYHAFERDRKCESRNGKGWLGVPREYNTGSYLCAGRCGSDYWIKCKRNYPGGDIEIPDDSVRLFSGLDATQAQDVIHYKDFKIGEYGYIGDDLNDKVNGIAVPKGLKAIIYEGSNFKGIDKEILGSFPSDYNAAEGGTFINLPGNQMSSLKVEKDCTDSQYTFDPTCDQTANVPGSLVFNARKTFCNASVENAYSKNCVDTWCKSNSTECNLLNAKQDCIKYGFCMDNDPKLCSNKCTGEEIAKLKAQCEKSGLRSEQGSVMYGCTPKGLQTFYKDCKDFGLSEDVCTAIELQNAKTNQFNADQLKMAKTGQETSQANYQQTRDTIMSVLTGEPVGGGGGSSAAAQSGGVADLLSDPTVLIMGGIVGVLLICSSSSLLLIKQK